MSESTLDGREGLTLSKEKSPENSQGLRKLDLLIFAGEHDG
jgi:hypothetical protein